MSLGHTPTASPLARAVGATLRIALVTAALMGSATALAQATPAGLWKIIDDNDGSLRGLMEITERNGLYSGKLVKTLPPSEGPPDVCDKCTDARRNQPIIGMKLMTGLRKTGDNEWSDGEILDPETGRLYHCKMSLANGGAKLRVRGFFGISLLGRTQTWERER
jgi:uncharacterized protein (DUF2147 family)